MMLKTSQPSTIEAEQRRQERIDEHKLHGTKVGGEPKTSDSKTKTTSTAPRTTAVSERDRDTGPSPGPEPGHGARRPGPQGGAPGTQARGGEKPPTF